MTDQSGQNKSTPQTPKKRAKKGPIKKTIFGLMTVGILICLLEGCATFALIAYDLIFWSEPVQTDRHHTQYDAEIGWVAVPNLDAPNLYGEGIGVQTNAQAFRNTEDTPDEVPAGKTRIICSGDSFTFGYGVNNNETWVARLADQNGRIDPVNIAMSGYGVDQMYLWYLRACKEINHDIHIVSFISHDFVRARRTKMFGYNKPRFQVNDGQLVAENTPVPESGFQFPWLAANAKHLQRSSLIDAVGKVKRAMGSDEESKELTDKQVMEAFDLMLADLKQKNEAKNSQLVLVHLPTKENYYTNSGDELRQALAALAAKHGILHIDLIGEIRKLTAPQAEKLFFQDHEVNDPGSAKHPSPAGHLFFAEKVYEAMAESPSLKDRLTTTP